MEHFDVGRVPVVPQLFFRAEAVAPERQTPRCEQSPAAGIKINKLIFPLSNSSLFVSGTNGDVFQRQKWPPAFR